MFTLAATCVAGGVTRDVACGVTADGVTRDVAGDIAGGDDVMK